VAEKKLIYAFEKEAQELEKEEMDLIDEVKQIQQEEIEAYRELEEAMLTAKISKKDRVSQG